MPDRTDAYLDLAILQATASVACCAWALASSSAYLAALETMRRQPVVPDRPRLRLIAGGKA